MLLQKIISGGQSGVDRGALDACLKSEFPCGGWCPANRKAEDDRIPNHYPLMESWSSSYDERTRQNILDSDATLIIFQSELQGGTLLTHNFAKEMGKPLFLFKADAFFIDQSLEKFIQFLSNHQIWILNVAGPRASQWKEAHDISYLITSKLIEQLRN